MITRQEVERMTLNGAFSWINTPEGGSYWRIMARKYSGEEIGDISDSLVRETAIQRALTYGNSLQEGYQDDDQIIK